MDLGAAQCYPPVPRRVHPHALAVDSGLVVSRVICQPSTGGKGPSMWVGAFCIRKADYLILLSDMGVTYPFHSPHCIWPCLP